jgi:hypothetical protein
MCKIATTPVREGGYIEPSLEIGMVLIGSHDCRLHVAMMDPKLFHRDSSLRPSLRTVWIES